jgi:hypothetical protein
MTIQALLLALDGEDAIAPFGTTVDACPWCAGGALRGRPHDTHAGALVGFTHAQSGHRLAAMGCPHCGHCTA